MAELISMKNIGKELDNKLKSVGISSAEALIQTGSKEAIFRMRLQYSNLCLVHLYTLQGAIENVEYNQLSDAVKCDLKSFNKSLT